MRGNRDRAGAHLKGKTWKLTMRRAWTWIEDNGLLLVFCGLFMGFLVGQALCGEVAYNSTRARAGLPAVGHWKYLLTGNFLEGVFENWQAAILQLGSLILFGIFLRQRGAPHSRKNVHRRRGTLKNWLYGNSLTIAFAVLFLVAFAMHLYAGTLQANEQRVILHQPRVSMGQFLGSAQFWFTTFQTWEAEYMAIALYFFLSIFLRQEGSPESKPTWAANSDTGDVNH